MPTPSNCSTCDHKNFTREGGDKDPGHCYMFKTEPEGVCAKHSGCIKPGATFLRTKPVGVIGAGSRSGLSISRMLSMLTAEAAGALAFTKPIKNETPVAYSGSPASKLLQRQQARQQANGGAKAMKRLLRDINL